MLFIVLACFASESPGALTSGCGEDYKGTVSFTAGIEFHPPSAANARPRAVVKTAKGEHLIVEFDSEDTIHFEFGGTGKPLALDKPIYRTPMVVGDAVPNAPVANVTRDGDALQTSKIRIRLSADNLALEVLDLASGKVVARLKPQDLDKPYSTIGIENSVEAAYGFGEFPRGGNTDMPWLGSEAKPTGQYGNAMTNFYGGASSYTQFPIAYGLTPEGKNFGLFFDMPYGIHWDLRNPKDWKAHMHGDQVRGYIMVGDNLKDLRQKYMNLTGLPKMPPRGVFGFGVSKFGYRDWEEVFKAVEDQRHAGIPVTSVALDLYWFGGSFVDPNSGGPKHTSMGRLLPDRDKFPDFRTNVERLKRMGIDVMPITESYVNINLAEARFLEKLGCIAKDKDGRPIILGPTWFGTAYMIDWSHPKAKEWIRYKYGPLVKAGIRQFWLDLGEPEMYSALAKYHGVEPGKQDHADIHNLYNLLWTERFMEAMKEEFPDVRFYLMNRSGTSGLQRNYSGKWGGDSGATVLPNGDVPELIAHLQNRISNMPFVGVDYYTSDVGGFHRYALNYDATKRDKVYTVWFANSSLLDIPFRPHLWIKPGEDKYLPTETGHPPSNKDAVRLRFELTPYYYSLARGAETKGQPIIAPMVYHFENDPTVRKAFGHQAMIGPNLMMGVVGNINETQRNVYLPEGRWYDFYDNTAHEGDSGRWLNNVPVWRDGKLKLPLFAREGAIVPLSKELPPTAITNNSMRYWDYNETLRVRVFAGRKPTRFSLYEDDGKTNAPGASTPITQSSDALSTTVTIEAQKGQYFGRPNPMRPSLVEIVSPNRAVESVTLQGKSLEPRASREELERAADGFYFDAKLKTVVVKTGPGPVRENKTISVRYQSTPPG